MDYLRVSTLKHTHTDTHNTHAIMFLLFAGVHTHLCMLGVALERYLTIILPLSYYYYITTKTCASAIVIIMIASLIFPLSMFLPGLSSLVRTQEILEGNFTKDFEGSALLNGTNRQASFGDASDVIAAGGFNDNHVEECTATTIVKQEFSVAFECILLFISVVTITLYCHLCFIAESHLKRMREQQGHIQLMFLQKNKKASVVAVKIFLTFVCFQWPSRIINILATIGFEVLRGSILQYFFHGCTLLVSICNPFIYSYFNKDFNTAFRKLVLRRGTAEVTAQQSAEGQIFERAGPVAISRVLAPWQGGALIEIQ